MAGLTPAAMGGLEGVVMFAERALLEPALDDLFAQLQKDAFAAHFGCWYPRRSFASQAHDVIFRQFLLFGVVAERLDARKAGQGTHFAQALDQHDLFDDVNVFAGRFALADLKVIGTRCLSGVAENCPFGLLEFARQDGVGSLGTAVVGVDAQMRAASGTGGMIAALLVAATEGLGHALAGVALLALDVDIGNFAGEAVLFETQDSLGAGFAAVDIVMPGKVVEMASLAGDHKTRREGGRSSGFGTVAMSVLGLVGITAIGFEVEEARIDWSEQVTVGTDQPARKGGDRHANGAVGRVKFLNRWPAQRGNLFAQHALDGVEQALLFDLL